MLKHFEISYDMNSTWKELSPKSKAGMIVLNLANLGPFFMSLFIIFVKFRPIESLIGDDFKWPLFFSLVGPVALLMSAVILEVWINFFIFKKSKAAWWAVLFGTLWISLNDSMAIIVFNLKYPQFSPIPLAPFVAGGLLLGLYLIKDHIFKNSSTERQTKV